MIRAAHIVIVVLALGCFALLLERHTAMPLLAAERARAQHFAGVIAACANGQGFTIADTSVRCRPEAAKKQ